MAKPKEESFVYRLFKTVFCPSARTYKNLLLLLLFFCLHDALMFYSDGDDDSGRSVVVEND